MSKATTQGDFTPEEWDRMMRLAKRRDREEFCYAALLWVSVCVGLIATPAAIVCLVVFGV